ncbi:MAG: hypothetical protein J6Y80_04620, partial [Victivallales bacterium]|nr:hypothetical protein [Victivallales bacterium]
TSDVGRLISDTRHRTTGDGQSGLRPQASGPASPRWRGASATLRPPKDDGRDRRDVRRLTSDV